jgi:signal transduction histidine kinase
MLHRIHTSLHLKLILAFSLVMLLPTLAIALYTLGRIETVLISRISADQLRLAAARATTVESQIAEAGADLLFVLQSSALHHYAHNQPGADAELSKNFQSFLEGSFGRYSAICMLEMSGRERVCVRAKAEGGYAPVPAAGLRSRHATSAFISAMRQSAGIPSSSPLTITGGDLSLTGPPLLAYSLLYVDDEGSPVGVLVLEAPVVNLLADLTDPEPGVSTNVINSTGAYIFSSDRDLLNRGEAELNLSQTLPNTAQSILRQPAGVIINTPDRPGRFLVFTRIRPTGQNAVHWTVIYERPVESIMAVVRETRVVIISLTVLAIGMALALASLLASGIVRPIRALANAAERVGAGNLLAAIPSAGQDEIGALGRTFAQMVTRLRESLAAAEQRSSEAETLAAASRALGATLDREQVLDLILSELGRVVPFDSASVQEVRDNAAVIIACYGLKDTKQIIGSSFTLEPGATANAEVARTRAPLILDDAPAHYSDFCNTPFNSDPIRSWLGVPMIFGERLVGMISLDKHKPGYYQAEHARLALAFAAQAAAAMENARLYAAARRDLADRQRAEAAYARMAAIIEATTDLVGMANMEGQMLFLNQAGRRALALGDETSLEHIRIADLFPPRLLPWLRKEAVPGAIREGAWSGETVLLTRAGDEIPVSQVIICHYGPDGRPELLSTIVRDMRERRRAEEELRQAQKMEALGRLAGGLAHDFNNLLTVILGEVDLLLLDLPPDSPLLPSAEQIRGSGTRAAALTSQLLAFSRRQVLQAELLSLNAVIGEIEQMLRRLIGEHILLSISLDPQLPLVRADPGQIQQVVMNLAINARDAMPGGGTLRIATAGLALDEAPEALHPGVAPGRYALLSVSDTGAGIDDQSRDHIFEPFFTTKDRGKGTGLGLATVHGIVRQSGGQIGFESSSGRGTVFRIYLPAVADAGMAAYTPADSSRARGQPSGKLSGTVLLAEDDDDVRALAGQILARQGLTVLTAGDGQAALALARAYQGPIHLLLTDVVMPGGLNGVELATALSASRPQLRVLYMSGYTDNALIEHSLSKRGTGYLQKPFTPDALTCALVEVLA